MASGLVAGTLMTLRVKNGGTSSTAFNYTTYIKFDIAGLSGTVASAKLYCVDPATSWVTLM